MSVANIVGAFATPFGKHHDKSYKQLVDAVIRGVLADGEFGDGGAIDMAWFANTSMQHSGQHSSRGQVVTIPLVRDGTLPERMPITNVENACASGSSAFASAVMAVQAGQAELALAFGAEKLIGRDGKPRLELFHNAGALDCFDPEEWQAYYQKAGATVGKTFEFAPDRSPFMDTYAVQAAWHMRQWGTTQRQFAIAAANAHEFGKDNPRAQYRFGATPESVLADREVSYPLTRAMCAPLGDGASAILVCSSEFLKSQSDRVRARAVRVRGIGSAGGIYRALDQEGLSAVAGRRAYERAGVGPNDIDLAEVHDATAFSQIFQPEMLGFCPPGEGGRLVEAGDTRLGGRIPLNTSGGLIAKGHPIGATGCSMIAELVEQLRGEAGPRQVEGARLALAENGGGVIGFDEAVAYVTILESLQ